MGAFSGLLKHNAALPLPREVAIKGHLQNHKFLSFQTDQNLNAVFRPSSDTLF